MRILAFLPLRNPVKLICMRLGSRFCEQKKQRHKHSGSLVEAKNARHSRNAIQNQLIESYSARERGSIGFCIQILIKLALNGCFVLFVISCLGDGQNQ